MKMPTRRRPTRVKGERFLPLTFTAPPSYASLLEELGDGNRSAGFRLLVEQRFHLPSATAESSTHGGEG
jgi:hypothetical protein